MRDTLDAGDRGVVFGRDVWQTGPAKMIGASRRLVHPDGAVDGAAELLR